MSRLFVLVLLPFAFVKNAAAGNHIESICENTNITKAGDEVFACYNRNANHLLDANQPACTQMTERVDDFVGAVKLNCYKNKNTTNQFKSKGILLKLFEYSIKTTAFEAFIRSNGLKCISEIRNKLADCSRKVVGNVQEHNKTEYRKYNSLWEMTDLSPPRKTTCLAAHETKQCALKAMREAGGSCIKNRDSMFYVSLLFDYMLAYCDIRNYGISVSEHTGTTTDDLANKKIIKSSYAMLIVLIVFGVLAMFYVCFRDCRSPRGPWKALNERISMSAINRRRSLVHNEGGN